MPLQCSFSMREICRTIVVLAVLHRTENVRDQLDVLSKNLGHQFMRLFNRQRRPFF
jgi:hypothetical protein